MNGYLTIHSLRFFAPLASVRLKRISCPSTDLDLSWCVVSTFDSSQEEPTSFSGWLDTAHHPWFFQLSLFSPALFTMTGSGGILRKDLR